MKKEGGIPLDSDESRVMACEAIANTVSNKACANVDALVEKRLDGCESCLCTATGYIVQRVIEDLLLVLGGLLKESGQPAEIARQILGQLHDAIEREELVVSEPEDKGEDREDV